ncbi:fasciclin domain-containing protein [Methylocapsa aurea]|uniref:fasciclin domain-containing protein n=1 Tax=Methylocapsa aurea TaxID=663610 RepID=UPI000A073779|nr:fasciclin domain-containing protein [Methylocapsa aurea]
MRFIRIAALAAGSLAALAGVAIAEDAAAPQDRAPQLLAPGLEMSVEVGGAPMYPSKTIVENAVNSKDHTILAAALKAADLVDTLQGAGPFTVFAPVNKAFEKLPKGMLDNLLKPENKAALTGVLSYHVVPGKYSVADFVAAVKKAGGKAVFTTIEGEDLTVEQNGRKLEVIDARGGKAIVTIPDVNQKNGVIHVVDSVLSPKI